MKVLFGKLLATSLVLSLLDEVIFVVPGAEATSTPSFWEDDRPDVLRCSEQGDMFWNAHRTRYSHAKAHDNTDRSVVFDTSDGEGRSVGPAADSILCKGRTLNELVDFGYTYQLVTSTQEDPNIDGTSMVPGWPDAIKCDDHIYYMSWYYPTVKFHYNSPTVEDRYVHFDAQTKMYLVSNGSASTSTCQGRSIQTLYRETAAFNLVSSRSPDPFGLTSIYPNWPEVINCGGDIFYISEERGNLKEYRMMNSVHDRALLYDQTGNYNSQTEGVSNSCRGLSIAQLYAQGLAFNLVSPGSSSGNGKYFFEYTMENQVFEDVDVSNLPVETISSQSKGVIKNCAGNTETTQALSLDFGHETTRSMTTTKSWTTSATQSFTAGVSVTVQAEAGAIFAKTSVATTASFEYSNEWTESSTDEQSTTMTDSREIDLSVETGVVVGANTCTEYTAASHVSTEPVRIPYTATVRLALYSVDRQTGAKAEKITDGTVLGYVRDVLNTNNDSGATSYGAVVDDTTGTIVFPTDGVYEGVYISESFTETNNCDLCNAPGNSGTDASATSPRDGGSSSGVVVLGIVGAVAAVLVIVAYYYFVIRKNSPKGGASEENADKSPPGGGTPHDPSPIMVPVHCVQAVDPESGDVEEPSK